MPTEPPQCRVTVRWEDLDMTVRCTLPARHDGPHADGVRWWDQLGYQLPREEARR